MRSPGALAVTLAVLLGSAVPAGAAEPTERACCTHEAPTPATIKEGKVLPNLRFTDQRGRPRNLPDGRLWAVAFFYGSCKTVCPRLIYNLNQVQAALPTDIRDKVVFAAITFDPAQDTAQRLVELAKEHDFQQPNQYLLRADAATTRTAVETFGFDYKPDGQGGFRHSNLLALMDSEGRVVKHFYGLDPNLGHVTQAIRANLP
jgi:protein SCO1/2